MSGDERVSVRHATFDDLDFVSQDGYIPAEVVRRKIEWREVVVAERGERPVGYARLEYLWSSVPYLALIRVTPPAERGRGVGRALIGYLEEFLRRAGHEALYSSAQADEPKSQAWHRRAGFEECGMISGINRGGVGEVFFRKRLGG
jgi:N-acetylglutamate synthase-like GNAT family acetyltransferase